MDRIAIRLCCCALLLLPTLGGCGYRRLRGPDGHIDGEYAHRVIVGVSRLREHPSEIQILCETAGEQTARPEPLFSAEQLEAFRVIGLIEADEVAAFSGHGLELATAWSDPGTGRVLFAPAVHEPGFWAWLAASLDGRDHAGELMLAHEVTHLLIAQDARLIENQSATWSSDDRRLALFALREGDASYTSQRWIDPDFQRVIDADEHPGYEALAGAPPLERAIARLGRVHGAAFVASFMEAAVEAAGQPERVGLWRRLPKGEVDLAVIDLLYSNLPSSTEQILDPTHYLERYDGPVTLTMDVGPIVAPHGYVVARQNTLGAFLLGVLAGDDGAVMGWRGDRYAVIRSLATGEEGAVLRISLEDDAGASGLAFLLADAYGRKQRMAVIRMRGRELLVMVGLPAPLMEILAGAVW